MPEAIDATVELLKTLGYVVAFLVFFIPFLVITMNAGVSIAERKHLPWIQEFAERIGGKVIRQPKRKLLEQLPRVDATYKGHFVRLSLTHIKGPDCYVALEVPVPHEMDMRLEIARRRDSYLRPRIGKNDPEIFPGDASFGSEFRVTTNNPRKAMSILEDSDLRQIAYHAEDQFFSTLTLHNGVLRHNSMVRKNYEGYTHGLQRMMDLLVSKANQLGAKPVLQPSSQPALLPDEPDESPDLRNNEEYLRWLVRDLFGGKWESSGSAVLYTVTHRKWPLTLKCVKDGEDMEITVQVIQKFWLRILPQFGPDTESEILTGDADLDSKLRIYSDHKEIATPFLQQTAIIEALKALPSIQRLEIHRAKLRFHFTNPVNRRLRRSTLERLLQQLLLIAETYGAQKMLSVAVNIAATPAALCPYCREKLAAESVSCASCRTAHHQACWNENTQCTTWGCSSTATV